MALGISVLYGRAAPDTPSGKLFCYILISVAIIAFLALSRAPSCPADDLDCQGAARTSIYR